MRRWSGWLTIPALAAAIGLAGGGAFAAARGPVHRAPFSSAFWTAVAAKIGVSATTLESAAESVWQQERSQMAGPNGAASNAGPAWRTAAPGRRAILTAAASYLGLSPSQVRNDLRAGETLAEIANAQAATNPNVSVAGLEATLESAITANVATEVNRLVNMSFAHQPAGGGASGQSNAGSGA
jgi:hypothetical protein